MADFKSITSHYRSISGSVAAGQNSELSQIDFTANWFSTNRHIDCNCVPFSIGFHSITSKILVIALSNRYTYWSMFITRNDIHV